MRPATTLTLGLLLWAVLGAVIITRHPRHRIGWLFVVAALLATAGNCLFAYDAIATSGPSPDPAAIWPWAVWLAILLDTPVPLLVLILLFLLFPTGHLPSRRWRPLLWATWGSFGGVVVSLAVVVPLTISTAVGASSSPGAAAHKSTSASRPSGQRTSTNARTRKGPRKAAVAKKKAPGKK